MDRYVSVLYEIVTRGFNTNSYKFALWRALARLATAKDDQNTTISKRVLASIFLEYYWPLEVKYHLRQGTDPDKDPIVMVLVRRLMKQGKINQGELLKDFQKRMPSEYQQLVASVERNTFDDVIPRFHVVHGAPIAPPVYTFTGRPGKTGDTINLTDGGRRFLVEYARVIDYVAVSAWVRFTEAFTSAPRLHDKISGARLKRAAVSRWRDTLIVIQDGKCFYDARHDMSATEVDHVLPWSFVLEDRTWNLVLACRKCNNDKRDKLTSVATVEKLCTRNEQLLKKRLGTDSGFYRHFDEWQSRNLSSYVKGLYDQAVADGFPKWRGPDALAT